jgi:DNA-3-methyladenine glycosylase I
MTAGKDEGRIRCDWHTEDPLYITYHDTEWGRPLFDSKALFEMLCLEGMQAGLSWITILKRRNNYRYAFAGFDPDKIACFTEGKEAELMQDTGIIRNRRKIHAIIMNARCFLEIEKNRSFSEYIWSFVGGHPLTHHYSSHEEIPAVSKESVRMSRDLKQRGFKFVGETICYAFMQATGMVNDHETDCFCYAEIAGSKSDFASGSK